MSPHHHLDIDPEVRRLAIGIRCREMGQIVASRAGKELWASSSTLLLSQAERDIIAKHIANLLIEITTGATTLEPNKIQMQAAAAGKTEVTEADMQMFAARLIAAQVGNRLPAPKEVKAIE